MSGIIKDPAAIERLSFEIISSLIGQGAYAGPEFEVVKRVVHATADTEFAELMVFSDGAVDAGVRALGSGCDIITDVKMLRAGISPNRPGRGQVHCFISDPEVAKAAMESGRTRAAEAMRRAVPLMDGAIVAVGNAPTALYELLDIVGEGLARPALIVGVPVGFVGAAESKEELEVRHAGMPFITSRGRKGGSPVGAAIINALIKLSVNK